MKLALVDHRQGWFNSLVMRTSLVDVLKFNSLNRTYNESGQIEYSLKFNSTINLLSLA